MRIGFSLRDREIRVSFDLEYRGRRTRYCEKNRCAEIYYRVLRLTDFLVSYGSPFLREGAEKQKLSPKFLEKGLADRRRFCVFDRAYRAD